jgi:hypothetical protein
MLNSRNDLFVELKRYRDFKGWIEFDDDLFGGFAVLVEQEFLPIAMIYTMRRFAIMHEMRMDRVQEMVFAFLPEEE